MIVSGSRPVLLLDVGFDCTGVAVAALHDDGPHLKLYLIVPCTNLSPKTLNEKRAAQRFGDLAERLYCVLVETMCDNRSPICPVVFAEVPTMGSISAGGMRSMALALAAYRAACVVACAEHAEFSRNDVMAACFGNRKPAGDGKAATRSLVVRTFGENVDASALPHGMTKANRKLRDNAYDAAAVLFAARDHDLLRRAAGWGDWKVNAPAYSALAKETT
jgi:hypothetical protein